ncbi:MAG TPA: diadenylate cyclase CdaA [Bryobacteraceae bacterium]|nr:diadenylate cyclase CdaA [Bryobacteraceae bacterium]
MPQLSIPILPKLTLASALDILAVAVLIYNFILLLRGRRAMNVFGGLCVLLVVYFAALYLHLELLRTVLATMAPYSAIALIVIFQNDIRRVLARLGRAPVLGLGGQLERREMIDEIMLALDQMRETRTGALIVIERETGLRTFIESGVALDAAVSHDLLCSIFQTRSPLHDGAVIIQGDRMAAAACFLPLTTNPALSARFGTRHRAAIGVTEESGALAIVLSEETGQLSFALRGELNPNVSPEYVRETLTLYSAGRSPRSEPDVQPVLKRAQS